MAPQGNSKKGKAKKSSVPVKRRHSSSSSENESESESDSGGSPPSTRVTDATNIAALPADQAVDRSHSELGNASMLENMVLPYNYTPGDGGDPFGNKNRIQPEVIDISISLASVGGLEDQVTYIRQNILYPMDHVADFAAWGIEPMKGVIFHGPPGTGKSLLARALVSEITKNGKKVNFFMKKGSDCHSKWVGETEKNLRELFTTAKSMKPSIIFIDELDGLCPSRQSNSGSLSQFYTSIVTTLLGQIDSIKRGEVFLIAATNQLDSIDPALKRPGRFDKALAFLPPSQTGRKEILNIFLNKWRSNKPPEAVINDLSYRTVGFTGADLEQLCRDAFNCALNRQMPGIGKPDNGGKNYQLKDLRIIPDDWNAALSKMGRSNSNVFGNSIYTGDMVDPIIKPLIQGIVSEVANNVRGFLHTEETISDPTCKGAGIKSFLVTGSTVATVDIVDTLIFPSVMASFDAEKTPGFILSELTLRKTHLVDALQQVNDCRKTCFLFIPRIDKLWNALVQAHAEDTFRKGIEMMRSTNIILIASSTVQLSNFPDDLRSMFLGIHRSYSMRKPNIEERREFFSSIFDPNSSYMLNALNSCGSTSGSKKSTSTKEFPGKLKKLGVRAEQLTEDDEIKTVLALHGELAQICTKNAAETDKKSVDCLLDQMKGVLDAYEKNKLDHN